MKRLIVGAMLLISVASASAAQKNEKWVEVTKPMLACGSLMDSATLKDKVVSGVAAWKANKEVPANCVTLAKGERYLLDDQQTDDERHTVVKMWDVVCSGGCSPAATPVYAPSRDAVGNYLKPAKMPKRLDGGPN